MLIPYEQLYIQTYHKNVLLIPEQHTGDSNPLFQLITSRNIPPTHKYYRSRGGIYPSTSSLTTSQYQMVINQPPSLTQSTAQIHHTYWQPTEKT
jgi:hypothetical protein